MDSSKQQLFSEIMEQLKEQNKILERPFYRFFKEIKYLNKHKKGMFGGTTDGFLGHLNNIKKEELIIFTTNDKKIDEQPMPKKKVIFPFNKIFLSYPIIEMIIIDGNPILQYTDGFFIDSIKDDSGEIKGLLFISMWLDYGRNQNNLAEEGVIPRVIMLPYNQLNGELEFKSKFIDGDENDKTIHGNNEREDEVMSRRIIDILKKICFLIQKKEYREYYKYSPMGIQRQEIVYSKEVKSHKRHFWIDSGKFKIAKMPKEEVLKLGYEIDELVFRDNELRRDVPYTIIDSFKMGETKENNPNNRTIEILNGRNFKKEQELGNILIKLFPNEFIKRHDRKAVKPLELDYYLRNLNLAFEYDGEQHYDKELCENVFKSNFEELQKRDRKKDIMCRDRGIKLIRIKFDEPLGINLIKRKLKDKQNKDSDKGEESVKV
jgi:hypothetical protein